MCIKGLMDRFLLLRGRTGGIATAITISMILETMSDPLAFSREVRNLLALLHRDHFDGTY